MLCSPRWYLCSVWYLMVEWSAPCLTASSMKVVAAVWLCFTRIWSICVSSGWSNTQEHAGRAEPSAAAFSKHNARLTDGVWIHNCALQIDAQNGNRWWFACEWTPELHQQGDPLFVCMPQISLASVFFFSLSVFSFFAANWAGLFHKLNNNAWVKL